MTYWLQKAIFMFKAPDVQIVEMVRNRREKSENAVDIVGRFGYSEACLVTPDRFGYSLAEQRKRNTKQRSKN